MVLWILFFDAICHPIKAKWVNLSWIKKQNKNKTNKQMEWHTASGIIFMLPANEKRCYIVMPSLIGWVHTQNDPCSPEMDIIFVWLGEAIWDHGWWSSQSQCMKRPVAHSLNSTWFWIELPENCCEPLKLIMKYISIQFCERPCHGRPFHVLQSKQSGRSPKVVALFFYY